MFSFLLALSMIHPRRPDWAETKEKLLAVAETYKKWGISFEVEGAKELETNGPLPGKLEVTGTYISEDEMELHMSTQVGEKHALALEMEGTYKITAEGTAKESKGSIFVEGTGVSGSYENGDEGPKMETALEDALLKLGIQFGKADEGPLGFEVKLGAVTVKIDPSKYAQRLRDVGPTLVKKAGEKIGGVSLAVDADALATALADAPEPPANFVQSRLAVSLKGLSGDDLGELNEIQGVLVDDQAKDIWLVGVHNPGLNPIPTERLATVVQAVYLDRTHPFVSIDPQAGNFDAPHHSRIGGIGDAFKSSSLIGTMLQADYSMKKLFNGGHSVEGLPSLADLVEQTDTPIVATRFWINPAPLKVGDIGLSTAENRRLYSVRTEPLILTEPLGEGGTGLGGPNALDDMSAASKAVSEQWAADLTKTYGTVEAQWPEAQFGEARQDLELTNITSLLAEKERSDWAVTLLTGLAQKPVPTVEVPTEFPAIDSRPFTVHGIQTNLVGGMTTEVAIPETSPEQDALVADWSPEGESTIDTGPKQPRAEEPDAVSTDFEATLACQRGLSALQAKDYGRAERESTFALTLKPGWDDAIFILLATFDAAGDHQRFDTNLDLAIESHPHSWKILFLGGLRALTYAPLAALPSGQLDLYGESVTFMDKVHQYNPSFTAGYGLQGKAYHRMAEEDSSLEAWGKAVQYDPNNPESYVGRSSVLAFQGKLDEALTDLNQALALNPNSAKVRQIRAEVLSRQDKIEPAITDAKLASEFSETDWRAWDLLGKLQAKHGDDADAVASLSNALALAPRDPFADFKKYPYPAIFFTTSLWDDFTKRCGDEPIRIMADTPLFDPNMLILRAKSQIKLGKPEEALKDLEACQELNYGDKDEVAQLIKECKGGQ